ncbi:SCO7613 C-terminal domain-containing membrane protein [Streptosporangium saharense]|uniref:SCO7613 C-terminal domain-containing membrane protein n=1 Tax=Streptosporangium saharense TaxID=1706840 RepID=UPI0036C1A309
MHDQTRPGCPGCGLPVTGTSERCPRCALPLKGPTAAELWRLDVELAGLRARQTDLLARRNHLLGVLRAEGARPAAPAAAVGAAAPAVGAVGAAIPAVGAGGAVGGSGDPGVGSARGFVGPGEAPRRDFSPKAVQNLLLTLGGLLLIVAAVVFTVVSWGHLGIGGRAAILAGVTALTLAAPKLLVGRGLGATAETIAMFGVALLLLDGYAARQAGLFGADGPEASHYAAALVGLVALVMAGYSRLLPLRLPLPVAVVFAQIPLPLLAFDTTAPWFTASLTANAVLDAVLLLLLGAQAGRTTAKVCFGVTWTLGALYGLLDSVVELTGGGPVTALARGVLLVALAALGLAVAGRAGRVALGFLAFGSMFALAMGLAAPVWRWLPSDWRGVPYTVGALVAVAVALYLPGLNARVRRPGALSAGAVAGLTALPVVPWIASEVLTPFMLLERVWAWPADLDDGQAWPFASAALVPALLAAALTVAALRRPAVGDGGGGSGAGGSVGVPVGASGADRTASGVGGAVGASGVGEAPSAALGVDEPVGASGVGGAAGASEAGGAASVGGVASAGDEPVGASEVGRAVGASGVGGAALGVDVWRLVGVSALVTGVVAVLAVPGAFAFGHMAALVVPLALAVALVACLTLTGEAWRAWTLTVVAVPVTLVGVVTAFATRAETYGALAVALVAWTAATVAGRVPKVRAAALVMAVLSATGLIWAVAVGTGWQPVTIGLALALAAGSVLAVGLCVTYGGANEEAVTPEAASRRDIPQEEGVKEGTARKATGQEATDQGASSRRDTPQKDTPQKDTAREDSVREEAVWENSVWENSVRENPVQEGAGGGDVREGFGREDVRGDTAREGVTREETAQEGGNGGWPGRRRDPRWGAGLGLGALLGMCAVPPIAGPLAGIVGFYRPLFFPWTGQRVLPVHLPILVVVAALLAVTAVTVSRQVAGRGAGLRAALVASPVLLATLPLSVGLPYPVEIGLFVVGLVPAAWAAARSRTEWTFGAATGLWAASLAVSWSLVTQTATLVTLPVVALAAAVTAFLGRERWVRAGGACVATLLAGMQALAVGLALDWPARTAAFGVLAVACVAAAVAGRFRRETFAAGTEVAGYALALVGLALAADGLANASLACAVVGVMMAGTALRPDRRRAGYVGTGLLLVASWLRLLASDITVIEAYTVPFSLVLLGFGWWRARGQARSSWLSYGPALGSSLLPSAVAVLNGSGWVRPLLLGLVCLAVLLAGARARLQAPALLGGLVLAVVVLHELAPWIAQAVMTVPRWVPMALGGLLLVVVGATYEARLRDVRRLRAMVGRMH